jgi:hypothetical protein
MRERRGGGSLSDIGILNDPGDLALIVLILGWPLLLSGAAVGALVGWRVRRKRGPWVGLVVGTIAGLFAAAVAFVVYAGWHA